jgi:DNA-binding transcriptional LysR family regulator
VYSDELIFVVPPQHPLARESRISIRQLGAESFVAHIVSSPYREKVIQAFRKYKTPLHMGVQLPTLQAIKRFVAMGNGVAFLPEISVEDEIARGELVRIPVQELNVHRKLRLIYRKSATLSHAGRAFGPACLNHVLSWIFPAVSRTPRVCALRTWAMSSARQDVSE